MRDQPFRRLTTVVRRGAGSRDVRSLARGTLWSVGFNVANLALGFSVQLLLAHSLGKAGYGTYIYALGWMQVALLASKLELDSSAVRFIGAYGGTSQWALMRGFVRRSHQIVGVISLVIAGAGALAAWFLRSRYDTALLFSYLWACALLAVMALLQLKTATLQGLHRVREAQVPSMLVRPGLFALAIGVALVAGVGLRPEHAVALNAGAALVALLFATRSLRTALPAPVLSAAPTYRTTEWLHAAFGILLISVAQLVVSQQSDVLVVGTLLGRVEAGQYGVASQLSSFITFFVLALTFVVAPRISDLHARGDRVALQRLVVLAGRANLLVTIPVFVGAVLFGRTVLGWFGPGFSDGYTTLVVLGLAQVSSAAVGQLAGFIMTMTGHQYQAGLIIGGSAALNLALALVFTPLWGAVGTALATLIAALVRATVLSIYIWRTMRLRVLPL